MRAPIGSVWWVMVSRREPRLPVVKVPGPGESWREVIEGPVTDRLAHGLACSARWPGVGGGPVCPVSYSLRGSGWRFAVDDGREIEPGCAVEAVDAWLRELAGVDGWGEFRSWCWSMASSK